jgi:cyclopropane fatty-acyl-phospholipid synthase-like methyltransferase
MDTLDSRFVDDCSSATSWTSAERLYDDRGTDVLPSDGPDPIVNMGLWRAPDGARAATLHEANMQLFDRVLDLAEIRADATLIDVGCGFGTALLRAASRTAASSIVGVNVSEVQLDLARRAIARGGLGGRVRCVNASATALPFETASIDHVISVEAAFHFAPRAQFFREAQRVLRPGGTLVVADLLLAPPSGRTSAKMLRQIADALAFPTQNACTLSDYRAEVETSGLRVSVAESVGRDVVPSFRRWMLRNSFKHRAARKDLGAWPYLLYPLDYVLLRATRPLASAA